MQDQLNQQLIGKANDLQLVAQGHSRQSPMKAFGSLEWETPGPIKARMKAESKNSMH